MDDNYWKGKYDESNKWKQDLIDELHNWKIAFGWSLAGIIIALFLAVLK
jgi:hypothetical protein